LFEFVCVTIDECGVIDEQWAMCAMHQRPPHRVCSKAAAAKQNALRISRACDEASPSAMLVLSRCQSFKPDCSNTLLTLAKNLDVSCC
jgi:hypothetical protein